MFDHVFVTVFLRFALALWRMNRCISRTAQRFILLYLIGTKDFAIIVQNDLKTAMKPNMSIFEGPRGFLAVAEPDHEIKKFLISSLLLVKAFQRSTSLIMQLFV